MRNIVIVSSILVAFTLGGCANMTETQKGTAKGAGIGAGVGAVIGAIAGNTKGAVIGAAVGAAAGGVAGNVWTKRQEAQKRPFEIGYSKRYFFRCGSCRCEV
jgi:uncharacterized protein YcfJ